MSEEAKAGMPAPLAWALAVAIIGGTALVVTYGVKKMVFDPPQQQIQQAPPGSAGPLPQGGGTPGPQVSLRAPTPSHIGAPMYPGELRYATMAPPPNAPEYSAYQRCVGARGRYAYRMSDDGTKIEGGCM